MPELNLASFLLVLWKTARTPSKVISSTPTLESIHRPCSYFFSVSHSAASFLSSCARGSSVSNPKQASFPLNQPLPPFLYSHALGIFPVPLIFPALYINSIWSSSHTTVCYCHLMYHRILHWTMWNYHVFYNSFIEIQFTYFTIHTCKVWISIFTELCNHYHNPC